MNSAKKDRWSRWLERIRHRFRGSGISITAGWETLVETVKHSQDVERTIRARQVIAQVADRSRLPELYALLQHRDFLVRETAAEPLARLEGVRALPALFRALTQGVEDGQDNDSLTPIIDGVIENDKAAALPVLLNMLKSPDKSTRANAAWGLGCYRAEITPQPQLEALDDPDPQVQVAAAGSLESFRHHPLVFEALLAKSHSQVQPVREAAIRALDVINNNDRTNDGQ